MGRLDGKVALITGAARGTGEVTARLFVEQGARVVLADILDERGAAVAAELGDRARFVHLDVSSEQDWAAAVAGAEAEFGSLNVLVNNAGVLHLAAIPDTTIDDFWRVVKVNQLGTFLGIRSVVEPMKRAGGGSIVNISSIDGIFAKNGVAAYASSKWAVRGLTRVAALELGRWGIRVNAVCPEAGNTDMIRPWVPAGVDPEQVVRHTQPHLATQKRRSTAEKMRDIAWCIVYLASDESASCTGADFVLDGGNMAGIIVRGAPGA